MNAVEGSIAKKIRSSFGVHRFTIMAGISRLLPRLVLFSVLLSGVAGPLCAQTEKVLHSFRGGTDGAYPETGLVQDAQGNLYGTTSSSGAYSWGTVYKITATGTETVLHSFGGTARDGQLPRDIVQNSHGILFGTTYGGGAYGYGTVFEMSTGGSEKVLYSFTGNGDGAFPSVGSLILDSTGNLYGTTSYRTAYALGDGGAVFELVPGVSERILYAFTGGTDGFSPYQGLVRDGLGYIYGTTGSGGAYGYGTAFSLSPGGVETVQFSFTGGTDGAYPGAGLTLDGNGYYLFGTTELGGSNGDGTVFVTGPGSGEWVLYNFAGTPDGRHPYARVIQDSKGYLYGTTEYGGAYDHGTVFKLSPNGVETVLHSFTGAKDGGDPRASLIQDAAGNLYGTTWSGGAYGLGTVFVIQP